MSTCRNQLMNEGKPYPRSGCDICGSMLAKPGGLVCTQNVQPNPPAGSTLEAKHYIRTESSSIAPNANKFAVIYTDTIHHEGDERSRINPGHGYPAYTETIQTIKTFENEAALTDWIIKNDGGYGRKTFKAIRYQELKVETKVNVSLS